MRAGPIQVHIRKSLLKDIAERLWDRNDNDHLCIRTKGFKTPTCDYPRLRSLTALQIMQLAIGFICKIHINHISYYISCRVVINRFWGLLSLFALYRGLQAYCGESLGVSRAPAMISKALWRNSRFVTTAVREKVWRWTGNRIESSIWCYAQFSRKAPQWDARWYRCDADAMPILRWCGTDAMRLWFRLLIVAVGGRTNATEDELARVSYRRIRYSLHFQWLGGGKHLSHGAAMSKWVRRGLRIAIPLFMALVAARLWAFFLPHPVAPLPQTHEAYRIEAYMVMCSFAKTRKAPSM